MYQTICDRIYNKIAATPDFPRAKVELLLKKLPPFSRDLPALICFLPYGEEIPIATEAYAAAMTAMTLSVFIHDDLNKNRAFTTEESVLNGDFLFAITFSLLPAKTDRTETMDTEASDIVRAYEHLNEKRLVHKSANPDQINDATALAFVQEDYGLLLRRIAFAAAKDNKKDEKEQTCFADIAEAIGILWGLRAEGYDVNCDDLIKNTEAKIRTLPWASNLTILLQAMK